MQGWGQAGIQGNCLPTQQIRLSVQAPEGEADLTATHHLPAHGHYKRWQAGRQRQVRRQAEMSGGEGEVAGSRWQVVRW